MENLCFRQQEEIAADSKILYAGGNTSKLHDTGTLSQPCLHHTHPVTLSTYQTPHWHCLRYPQPLGCYAVWLQHHAVL